MKKKIFAGIRASGGVGVGVYYLCARGFRRICARRR